MSQPKLEPTRSAERAGILDSLRGFALLGILLANAGTHSLFVFQSDNVKAQWNTAGIDRVLEGMREVLIDGKFYSLFSLLFGLGFAIIFFHKHSGEGNRLPFFYRRLFFLALFGLAHGLLIWDGDILFFYAVVGAFLPLFRKLSDRTLLILVPLLLLSPLLFDAIKVLTDGQANMSRPFLDTAMKQDATAGISEQNFGDWLLVHDRYSDVRAWNRSGFWWGWQLRLDSNRLPKVLAMFLLGLVVGRSRFYLRLNEHLLLLKRIMLWGSIAGIGFGLARLYFDADGIRLPKAAGLWDTLFYALSTAPLALAYAAAFCFWWTRRPTAALLRLLQPVGRMALTNYIAQSAFGVLFYYGVGLGFGGRVGTFILYPCLPGFLSLPGLLQPSLVAVFQFWPAGMALAPAQLWPSPAHSPAGGRLDPLTPIFRPFRPNKCGFIPMGLVQVKNSCHFCAVMNKRFYLFALVLIVAFSSCTTRQAERISKAQPWEVPLRLLGL